MQVGFDSKTGQFRGRLNQVVFDLMIRQPITQVSGDGATGKTLLTDMLLKDEEGRKSNGICAYPNVCAFSKSIDIDRIFSLSGYLIVIDRADFLTDKEVDFICRDRFRGNTYLIFARRILDLGLSSNYYGEFKVDGRLVTLDYEFSESGRF